MRILFVSREFPPETGGGGIGSYVASIAPGLAALGHDVHVLSCSPGQPAADAVLADGVTVHRRPTVRIRGLRRLAGKLGQARIESAVSCRVAARTLQGKFDVAEVPDWLGEGWLISRGSAIPTVSHLHTPLRLTSEFGGAGWGRTERIADWVERNAVRASEATTSPSQLVVDALRSRGWLDDRAVSIIRYPVDWLAWDGLDGVEDTEPVAAVIGRIEPRKGQLDLVEAAARFATRSATLRFIGRVNDEAYAARVRARAEELHVATQWSGAVDRADLPDRLASCRVVVMPSVFDSFGMAATEAMAAARPVVLYDSVGAAELLGDDAGDHVVPAGAIDALARLVDRYLGDASDAAAKGKALQELVRHGCDPSVIAAARLRCFEAVARG